MLYSLILACIISIDSLGIGITYGIRNTKLSAYSLMIVFAISFVLTYISSFLGYLLASFFPTSFSHLLGCLILISMGLWIIFHKTDDSDFDHSNSIDKKEACFLGLTLSMDAMSVSLGISSMNINSFLFPIFISFFNILFLLFGKYLAKVIQRKIFLPEKFWNICAGVLLIVLGMMKVF